MPNIWVSTERALESSHLQLDNVSELGRISRLRARTQSSELPAAPSRAPWVWSTKIAKSRRLPNVYALCKDNKGRQSWGGGTSRRGCGPDALLTCLAWPSTHLLVAAVSVRSKPGLVNPKGVPLTSTNRFGLCAGNMLSACLAMLSEHHRAHVRVQDLVLVDLRDYQ